MNDEAVCRTAPATPGLLNIESDDTPTLKVCIRGQGQGVPSISQDEGQKGCLHKCSALSQAEGQGQGWLHRVSFLDQGEHQGQGKGGYFHRGPTMTQIPMSMAAKCRNKLRDPKILC